MSKAFIAEVIQRSATVNSVTAYRAAGELINAIVEHMKKTGKFTLPSFGTLPFARRKRVRH